MRYLFSCWPWQAQAAATVAPTHQDTLNPWIPILVNTGFSKRMKATMSHFIVALPTAAPFANPYNSVGDAGYSRQLSLSGHVASTIFPPTRP
jgi:hypothetical protein